MEEGAGETGQLGSVHFVECLAGETSSSFLRDFGLAFIGFLLAIGGKVIDDTLAIRREKTSVLNEIKDLERWSEKATRIYAETWQQLEEVCKSKSSGQDFTNTVVVKYSKPMRLLTLEESFSVMARSRDTSFREWLRQCLQKYDQCVLDSEKIMEEKKDIRAMNSFEAQDFADEYRLAAINAALLNWNARELVNGKHKEIPDINDWKEENEYVNQILETTEKAIGVKLPRQ